MKLCKDCAYFNGADTPGECNHESNKKTSFVTGEKVTRMFPQDSRELDSMCGPDAKYFKEVSE